MLVQKKLNLDRFKKGTQGIIDFATIIEQADPQNRERILLQAREQDEYFLKEVMRRVVFFEELMYLDHMVIAEILSKVSAKVLSHALWQTQDEFRSVLLRQVGHRERKEIQDEEEKLTQGLTPSIVQGAQRAILKIARQLEAQNRFSFQLTNCPRFKSKQITKPYVEAEKKIS